MYGADDASHRRSISQNDGSSYQTSLHNHKYVWHSNRDKLSNDLNEERLKEQARRFVSRIRKQKQYSQGRYLLKRQKEELRKQNQEVLMESLKMEKREVERSKKMGFALEQILINQCKREKRMIDQLTKKIRQQSYQQNQDQTQLPNHIEAESAQQQIPLIAKRFKTVEDCKYQQTRKSLDLPLIAKTETNPPQYVRRPRKPKEEKQIYLTKIDQIKLKSIQSKINKLNKLFNESQQKKI